MYYFKIDVSFWWMKPCSVLLRRSVDLRGGTGKGEVELACAFSIYANAAHREYTHAQITSPSIYLRIVNSHPTRPSNLSPLSLSLSLFICVYITRMCVRAAAALTALPIRILLVLRINLLSCRVSFGVHRILPLPPRSLHRKEIFAHTTIRVLFASRSRPFFRFRFCVPWLTATDAFGRSPTSRFRLMYYVRSLPVAPLCTPLVNAMISCIPHGSDWGGGDRL